MGWLQLLIPLIFVAIWIISQLAKNAEQAAGRPKPPPLPRDDEDSPRTRRSAGEVDRFLEEVRRRRARADGRSETQRPKVKQQRPPPPRAPEPTPARSLPPLAPVPPPLPVPELKAPPRPSRLPFQPDAAARLQAIEMPVAQIIGSSEPKLTFSETAASLSRSTPLAQAVALLKNRQSLVAAVVLREILGPPVSKRRGRIPARRA